MLFGLLFFAALFNFAALAILAGPVAAEAAPIGMVASVAGLVIGAGEIFGGGIAPVIAGRIAQSTASRTRSVRHRRAGARHRPRLMLKETAPRKVGAAGTSGVRVERVARDAACPPVASAKAEIRDSRPPATEPRGGASPSRAGAPGARAQSVSRPHARGCPGACGTSGARR